MKSTGNVRKIDELGRIVLPKGLRRSLNIEEKDPIEILVDDDGLIVLKKHEPTCTFCDEVREIEDFKGKNICKACLGELKNFKN